MVLTCVHRAAVIGGQEPSGMRVSPLTPSNDGVWTGIEYPVAGLMFHEGMVEEACGSLKMTAWS